jgi:hypothetical protein
MMLHACLYTICFVFCYTLWHFYAFFRTNLLTRRHSASSLFLLFLCFRKATQEIFSELDETKAEPPIFREHESESKAETEGGRTWSHPRVAWAKPWPRHQGVSPPGPLPDAALPTIYSPRWENLKEPNQFPWNILQAATAVDARSGGSRSSSWHPAGEGNHCRRPSSSPCLPPEWCVSSLPWTTGP